MLKFFTAAVQQYFEERKHLGKKYTLKVGEWWIGTLKSDELIFTGRLLCSETYFNTSYSIYQMPRESIIVYWRHRQPKFGKADFAILDKLPGAGEWVVNGKFGGTEKIPTALLVIAAKESIRPWIS